MWYVWSAIAVAVTMSTDVMTYSFTVYTIKLFERPLTESVAVTVTLYVPAWPTVCVANVIVVVAAGMLKKPTGRGPIFAMESA